MTIGRLLEQNARVRPDDVSCVFEDDDEAIVTRTHAEVWERATRAVGALARAGVGPGDALHVHLPNCSEFFDCWFGVALGGAVMVPTNPLSTAGEIDYALGHAQCRLSVTSPDLAASLPVRRNHRVLVTGSGTELGSRFEEALADAKPGPLPRVGAGDSAAVIYTSGTTSRPKGVVVTHANYLHAGTIVAQHLQVRPVDRWLVALPLFHANAQYYSTMSALVTGASVAVMSRFSASRWGIQAARHGATLASLFAAPIRMILAHEPHDLDRSVRLRAVIFSQNVIEEQAAEFERRFDTQLLQLYGMTETIAPPTINPLHGSRRSMSIGLPVGGALVRIVDEDGEDVLPGEPGELIVHGTPGETLMAGYFDDEPATADAVRDGWLHTGDIVRVDADGYFYFVDRKKDMIKRAGENVAAGEVEGVINSHPSVFESAVIGVADEMRDEAIKAFVVAGEASLSKTDIVEWCAARIAPFKVPTDVEFVEALPRTSVGKIRKDVLRRRGAAGHV